MKIAFYAPLKPPDHAVPSGDRQMARLLMAALARAGHRVTMASTLRSFLPRPDAQDVDVLKSAASLEIERLSVQWAGGGRPDLWFCYHPYHKAPDLIGPPLARAFGIPYATAEASYSARRAAGAWVTTQASVVDGVRLARINLCFTRRDRTGLEAIVPEGRFATIQPFIDAAGFPPLTTPGDATRIVTLAMMRKGDKFDSFAMLARAVTLLQDLPWRLDVIGDGPLRSEVEALFSGLQPGRVRWLGEAAPDRVPELLAGAGLLAWPGCGEAYGLAYLEAQACGVPVAAQETAGVPEVVRHGVTGLLTPTGDVPAYANALRHLLTDEQRRRRMSAAAWVFAHGERSLGAAANRLQTILADAVDGPRSGGP